MKQPKDFENKLSEMLGKWCVVENNRRIYGFGMPQTKQSREDLVEMLSGILGMVANLSIVRKDKDIELVGEGWNYLASTLQAKGVIEVINSSLTRLSVDSITFKQGLSRNELEELFQGLNLSPEELDKQHGMRGFLKQRKVVNIQADQMHFELLKDGESIVDETENLVSGIGGSVEDNLVTKKEAKADVGHKIDKKQFGSLWNDYFQGKFKREDFMYEFGELIMMAKEKPGELLKVLKRIAKKQKDIEGFLADIEQKLTDIGFSASSTKGIRDKLLKPKRVSVSEDELKRLRKIEKDFQVTLEERVESSLSEIKKINKKLSEEKERINTILRQSSQGVIIINKEGQVLSLNSFAEKALGVSLKNSQQKKLTDIVKGDRMLSIASEWQKETGDFTPKDIKVLASDANSQDIISESSAVIEDENGKAIGMVSSVQSATMKEDMDKRKNEIMDMLGHDLRAPIYAAKQNLSVLTSATNLLNSLTPEQKEMVGFCQKNIEKMEKLVNTIMDVRQLETGKITLRKDDLDIGQLINESVDALRVWADDKSIKLNTNLKDVPLIKGDPERIYQVVTNLVSNALKFTPAGGSVDVSAMVETEASVDLIKIGVIDTGIGIKVEDLDRIFNKYEQVSLKSPKGESGMGLGLAICKTIIELHGGKIWAESQKGKGSSFFFTLPFESKD